MALKATYTPIARGKETRGYGKKADKHNRDDVAIEAVTREEHILSFSFR